MDAWPPSGFARASDGMLRAVRPAVLISLFITRYNDLLFPDTGKAVDVVIVTADSATS